ncbi:sugar ABC transporter permease [Deinococcus sp. Arct2-2]|nr:sugar ABC transporter permease [Deinococcus sp. Arct2-2]
MGGPALLLLTVFLVLPFFLAFTLSFTNQRLFSPNPTEFVGWRNFDRLLSVRVIARPPEVDPVSGQPTRGAAGEVQPQSTRTALANTPALSEYRPGFEFQWSGQSYAVVAKDPVFYRSLGNTTLFALIVVPLQTVLGLLLAVVVNRRVPGVGLFRAIYFLPVVTSIAVVSIIWVFLYNRDVGMINQFVTLLTFNLVKPIDWLGSPRTAMLAIGLMSAWSAVGFQMIIFLAGLQGIPAQLYEAASIDGASAWQRFRFVTVPSLRNTTVFVVILTTVQAFSLFTQVDIMTQGGPLDSTSTMMYRIVTKGTREQDIASGSAMSVVYILLIFGIALIQRRLLAERKST